ncbi:MAG: peptidoglycan DD-metalloendopeptidase family protein [Oscillospiraceae bacterium]|nr:peptidoglycan DD-metalloendopeptidase family protein [Oscillospiraceae bacterium]
MPIKKKVISLVLTMALLICVIPNSLSLSADYEDDLKALQDKYAQMEKKQEQLKKDIAAAQADKKTQQQIQSKVKEQITLTQEQIDFLEESIENLDARIVEKENEVAQKTVEIDTNLNLYKQRLRALYMSNTGSLLGALFGANSFSDFLTTAEYINAITKHDNTLLNNLHADKVALEQIQAEIIALRAETQTQQDEVEVKKAELDKQLNAVSYEIALLIKMEQEYKKNQAEIEAEMEDVQKEIDTIYEKMKSTYDKYVGGDFTWPVKNFYKISSPYGYRTWSSGYKEFHTGIDIAGSGIYGQPILAANTGTVMFVQSAYTTKGYGKYIIIDHGGGYSTLYAHASEVYVKLGDTVSRGETIGKVGSTGRSTGPHLHFEIRMDGKHQNPMNWFK